MGLIKSSHIIRRPHSFTFLISLFLLIQNSNAAEKKNSKIPNLIAYESADKKPPFAVYNNDPGVWADMNMVTSVNEMKNISTMCITGTFLVYDQPEFTVSKPEQMKLISGKDTCIPFKNISSIQLVTPISSLPDESSVSFFFQPYLQGEAIIFKKTLREAEKRIPGRVKSLIMHGDKPFTAISANMGTRYCLRPGAKGKKASKNYICLLMLNNQKDNLFSEAFRGCLNTTIDIFIEDCRPSGGGKLEVLKVPKKISEKKGQSNSSPSEPMIENDEEQVQDSDEFSKFRISPVYPLPITKCGDNTEFLELLDMRIQSDFESNYQVFYPKDKKHAWRTELLDNAFEIVMKACPDAIVSREFLQVVREFYIFLAEKLVWSKGGKGLALNASNEYNKMVDETMICNDMLEDSSLAQEFFTLPLEALSRHESFVVDPRLETFAALSPVMETIWLIFNAVYSMCHRVFLFKTNFWLDFPPIFNEMYVDLEEMKKEWLKPGKYSGFLTYLFGGGPYIKNLEYLSMCASTVFHNIPTLNVEQRPEGLPSPTFTKITRDGWLEN